jgi:hypothetical protein
MELRAVGTSLIRQFPAHDGCCRLDVPVLRRTDSTEALSASCPHSRGPPLGRHYVHAPAPIPDPSGKKDITRRGQYRLAAVGSRDSSLAAV